MEDKFRKILSKHPSIPAEKLLAYLEGRLGGAERMEVEMAMIESEFLSDAAEGLEQIGDTKRINSLVEGLNKGLRRKTGRDRHFYRKGYAGFPGWLAFTAFILLMLIIAGFLVLKLMSKG